VPRVTDKRSPVDPIGAIALLEEPNRRRLYDLVVAGRHAVGRDEAASTLGMSRELAAFHLDRLVEAGLLATEFRRRSGRTGPGAGRPAKLYRRADVDIAVTLPPRHYERASEVMATALDRVGEGPVIDAVMSVARERGIAAAADARRAAGPRPGRVRLRAALVETLRESGYEPLVEPGSDTVKLRNCPYDALADDHVELTCGMNYAWAEGLADGLSAIGLHPERVPRAGTCCVELRAGTEAAATPAGEGEGTASVTPPAEGLR
jgi:predicted ArsR family transcriptional regulator